MKIFKLLLIGFLTLGLCACGAQGEVDEPKTDLPSEQPGDSTPEPEPEPLPDPIELWVMDAPYNAKGDGVTNDRAAIQAAIDACYAAGGGTVYIPEGKYVCGTMHIKANVHVWLDKGATILGSLNRLTYELTMRKAGSEKEFIDELRCRNGNLEISMSMQIQDSRETL